MADGEQRSGMGAGTKILIILLSVLGVSCIACCGAFFYFAKNAFKVVQTPPEVIEMQEEIVSIEIPETYRPGQGMATKIFGMTMNMVMFQRAENPSSGNLVLMEMKMPMDGSQEQLDLAFQQQMDQQGNNQNLDIEETEKRTFTIDGEEREFTFNKGTSNGKAIRQVTGVFKSRNGNATMIVLVEDEDVWDEEQAVKMIESISTKE